MGSRKSSDRTVAHRVMLLNAADLAHVLTPARALTALARAYRAVGDGERAEARALGFEIDGGTLHVKAGGLPGVASAFVSKINVNRPGNPARGLPTVQGLAVLVDPGSGRPLAVIDSAALTGIRTAATAMLAATHALARPPRAAAVIGCGALGAHVVRHISAKFRACKIRVFDSDRARARAFVARAPRGTIVAAGIAEALDGAAICVTCTTAERPIIARDMLRRTAFVAAMGADNPGKRELDAATMRAAALLADDPGACAAGGEIRHALAEMPGLDVRRVVPLAALVAGRARLPDAPFVVFDSTGSGMQDAAAAWAAYRAARQLSGTRWLAFAAR